MSGKYEQTTGTGRRRAPTDEEIEKISADMLGGEAFTGDDFCSSLCRDLQRTSEELQELAVAIGQGPASVQDRKKAKQLIARMGAINARMHSMNCRPCFFE